MQWQLRMLALGLFLLAACGGEEPPVPCEDAGVYPGWRLKPAKLTTSLLPVSSCLADAELRATLLNHVQLTSDSVVATLSKVDVAATLDPSSNSLWLRLISDFEAPALEARESSPTLSIKLELDAAAVPEAETQVFQLDLDLSGQWSGGWPRAPKELNVVRGPQHSPAVRTLSLQPWVESTFDYRAIGSLEILRTAGSVSGTLDLEMTGALTVDSSQPPVARLGVVACFDTPLALRGVEVEAVDCGLYQIDLQGTESCGIQTAVREFGCRPRRVLDNRRIDAVTDCVRDKLASGQPFHVRVDIPSADTTHHVVWVRGEGGVMTRYSTYSISGGVWARRCSQPRVSEPTEGFEDDLISCDEVSGEWMICSEDQIF